jgi:quercetin dioxygenase-like cupin family protein
MSSTSPREHDAHGELVSLYAVRALPSAEIAAAEAQIAACAECRRELESLRSVVDSFVAWPTDVLRPALPLWDRLERRIAVETGEEPMARPPETRAEPEWAEAAPGISCKLLSTDMERRRVSMLVRLAPGTDYPPHEHADVEELYLLDGELIVDDKRLYPGDYLRAEPGTVDHRVWSETGCTCVLLTSTNDVLL